MHARAARGEAVSLTLCGESAAQRFDSRRQSAWQRLSQRWRGVHPTVITGRGAGLHPDMRPALVLGFVLFTALVALLILTRARLERLREELRDLHVEAARLGLTEDDR